VNKVIWKTQLRFGNPVRAEFHGRDPMPVHVDVQDGVIAVWTEHDFYKTNGTTWVEYKIVGTGFAYNSVWEHAGTVLDHENGILWHVLYAVEPGR